VKVKRQLKVVVDCSNGAASFVTPILLRELGCKVVTLNAHLDGHFPGRPSEPQPWNLGDLMHTVREIGADLGIAHDGDADRVAAVDERGNFVKHDALIALFAGQVVGAKGGGTVVTSVNTSVAIDEVVARAGGKTVRTGLGCFTEEMLKHNACFAGEPGKLVFLEFGPWADGVLSAAKLVELISSELMPFSEILEESVPDYPMFHQDFPCPDEKKQRFMEGMRQYIQKNVGDVREVLDVDGIRINRNDGSWVLARVSGTEPKARVVVEARSAGELEQLKKIALEGARKFLD
jgi:phosphomannomutase